MMRRDIVQELLSYRGEIEVPKGLIKGLEPLPAELVQDIMVRIAQKEDLTYIFASGASRTIPIGQYIKPINPR